MLFFFFFYDSSSPVNLSSSLQFNHTLDRFNANEWTREKKSERFVHKPKRCDSWRSQLSVIGDSFRFTQDTHAQANKCNFNFPKKAQKTAKTNEFICVFNLTISDLRDRSCRSEKKKKKNEQNQTQHVKLAINYLWLMFRSLCRNWKHYSLDSLLRKPIYFHFV